MGWLDRRRFVGIALVGVVVEPRIPIAAATTAIMQPIAALDEAILTAWKAGADTSFLHRYRILERAVTHALDLPLILRASIGPRWTTLPAADQTALLTVFERYTVASYVAGYARYGGQTIEIDPDPRQAGADWIVGTRTLRPDGKGIRIDYVMHPVSDGANGAWKAADVLLEGTISRVGVQRSDFRASLDETGAARLIARLRQRVADLSGGAM
jgi:phospholipid transport system substrate-binding protein